AIDVNTGPLGKFPEKGMAFFIEAVQSVTDLPLLIDTSNPLAMRVGLEAADNKVIINGFSLESHKLEEILPLAEEYDADIVGFLLYPDSRVPKDEAERFEIALELLVQADAAGVSKERIIIDPVVPPLAWEDGIVQARAVLNVIRMLPDLLGFPVRTIAGLSNLTTGAGDKVKKRLVEKSYIAMLAAAGLDYALMDVLNHEVVNAAKVSGILSRAELFSWEMVASMQKIQALMEEDRGSTIYTIRTMKPGDLGYVASSHMALYGAEYQFDNTFEYYVGNDVMAFGEQFDPEKENLWIAENRMQRVGSVAIVNNDKGVAQLRWLLVEASARGYGIGEKLVEIAVSFAREKQYRKIILMTTDFLKPARLLYEKFGFRQISSKKEINWGRQMYIEYLELIL
ncbi:MAG: GNAT family N-acetyltransferase, partial [Desulfobacula sp.]|uniref:GNAT family N-acetyltransferase n=1 Tax=Desulfobacula sp. TaxID=2593537 RepID=UPI0025C16F9F